MMDFKITSIVALFAAFSALLVLAEESCPPKICEEIKVSCLTCNGTMLFLAGPNCGCCPQCIPFRGEGEPCEDVAVADSKNATSMKEPAKADETGEKEKQENKEKKAPNICSPELTCLQGTCVVLF